MELLSIIPEVVIEQVDYKDHEFMISGVEVGVVEQGLDECF
jgi:hypothetical protein